MAELHGLKIPDLPPDVVPLRCVAMIEILMPNGRRQVKIASTDDVMTWEASSLGLYLYEYCRNQMFRESSDDA